MKTRAITGFFFIIVMLASVLAAPLVPMLFDVFYLVLSALCLNEFYSLVKQSGASPNRYVGMVAGVLVFCIFWLVNTNDGDPPNTNLLFILIPVFSLVLIWELFKKTSAPFINIAYTFLGIIIIVMPFAFFTATAYLNPYTGANYHFPLGFLLMLWANDTGAYLVGVKFGRTKLFERHSPKKTWEGFIGGVLIAAGVGVILSHFYPELEWYQWVIIALIISFFGTAGDLIESMFKRSINVKDSGGILPGHGGLLDRFDGLFLAAPIVYTYLYFISNS